MNDGICKHTMETRSNDYIKLYRSLIDWEWFSDVKVAHLWIYILLKANWKDGNLKGKVVKRGSFVTSYETMMRETGLSKQEIRTALSKLESTGEITRNATHHQHTITVEKYNVMQSVVSESNTPTTHHQHTNNTPSTQIEESKKVRSKEVKNKEISNTIPYIHIMTKPTVEEVEEYIKEKGYHFSAEEFVAHYESNGWMVGKVKMKDWRAACRTWERNAHPKQNKGKSFIGITDEIERKLGL